MLAEPLDAGLHGLQRLRVVGVEAVLDEQPQQIPLAYPACPVGVGPQERLVQVDQLLAVCAHLLPAQAVAVHDRRLALPHDALVVLLHAGGDDLEAFEANLSGFWVPHRRHDVAEGRPELRQALGVEVAGAQPLQDRRALVLAQAPGAVEVVGREPLAQVRAPHLAQALAETGHRLEHERHEVHVAQYGHLLANRVELLRLQVRLRGESERFAGLH
mmetsp:Transcript_105296/g.298026  ORF Transcript_105296/g.298026 Transcript_105296/m.298026 type:complete len:216 (-) Transcript_105296:967-1614(-)